MAKKEQKEKSIEETLWESANKLRGSVEPSEYKHVVLSLIFLKYAFDRFVERRDELIAEGKEAFVNQPVFYNAKNVFYLSEASRWDYLMENAKQNDIAIKIDAALAQVEKDNLALKGALPSNYYSGLGLDRTKLASLLDVIGKIDTQKDREHDLIGRVYEYFLGKFAIAEGKGKGEYYTPKTIVNLIAEMIQPYRGKIYDPCCGSGGMFVQSMKFIEAHHGNKKDISVYGQEYTNTTYKLAKMNLAIRGIACNLGEKAADTFHDDQHKDLKADFIMANPPFNQKAWRAENELTNDPRWHGYDVPPTSNANYGWILNIVSKLSTNGMAGFLLANGALSGDGTELNIRRQLLKNHLVEAIVILPRNMFYSTDISVTLWILAGNRKARTVEQNGELVKYRNRENEVLFIDLRQWGEPFEKKYIQFTLEQISQIAENFHNWQREGYEQTYRNVPEYCYSATLEEIEGKGWSLVPSKYIEFKSRDEGIDFDSKMKELQAEMKELLKQKYDGYHFSEKMTDIYNPFSLLNSFAQQRLDDYWFRSGTPSYLLRLLNHSEENLDELTNRYYEPQEFVDYKATVEKPLPMIYQSGYLTIKDYKPRRGTFLLDFPNNEVKAGFVSLVASEYLKPQKQSVNSWLQDILDALEDGKPDTLRQLFTSFLADIPYTMRRKNDERERERYFHYTFYLIFRLVSVYTVYTEKEQSEGRVDCIVEVPDYVYIFEFKLDGTAEEALRQIEEKGYARPYEGDKRTLYKIGVSFSSQTGTVEQWEWI